MKVALGNPTLSNEHGSVTEARCRTREGDDRPLLSNHVLNSRIQQLLLTMTKSGLVPAHIA
eukprot:925805-Amphidinium_carterae.1